MNLANAAAAVLFVVLWDAVDRYPRALMIFDCYGKERGPCERNLRYFIRTSADGNTTTLCLSDEIYHKILKFIRPKMLH
jgi:hypothetical protein